MSDDRLLRLKALKNGAQRLADKTSPWARSARSQLMESTGLSPEGITHALDNCLEHQVSDPVLSGLVRRTPQISRSFVLLSSNVFVATFRAIALGLCQSSQVLVRASSREPHMARLLHEGSGAAFELVDQLEPAPGDHFWAYGSNTTITELKRKLLPGVHLHSHGFGMGVAVIREPDDIKKRGLKEAIDALAEDTIAFDQRGCLSPRVVLIEGSRKFAESVCDLLVDSLDEWEEKVPRGLLNRDEQTDILRHEATTTFLGSCARAGRGMVFLDPKRNRVLVPPTGRYLNVTVCDEALPLLQKMGSSLTTVGFFNPGHLPGILQEKLGERRYVELGRMQTPDFNGPVDLRTGWCSEEL